MKTLINLTQHTLTQDQIDDLLSQSIQTVAIAPNNEVVKLITFNVLPTLEEINQRAKAVAESFIK